MLPKVYTREHLQQISDANGFTKHNVEIETERCQSDPMYAFFRRPEPIIDDIVATFLGFIKQKWNPDLEESKMASNGMLIATKTPCLQLKQFYVLFILSRDKDARKHMGIKEGSAFAKNLAKLIDDTTKTPFSERNIIELRNGVVVNAEMLYLTTK